MTVRSYALRMMIFGSMLATVAGCSSTKVLRTAANDPLVRILIASDAKPEDYLEVRNKLFEKNKFDIVERRDLAKVFDEQNLQFRSGYSERFDPREKYMMLGKLTGARGIITVNSTCHQGKSFWTGTYTDQCKLYLTLIDGLTGTIVVSVQGESNEPWSGTGIVAKDWSATVDRLVENFPKFHETKPVDPSLEQYKEVAEEMSKREDVQAMQRNRRPSNDQQLQNDIIDMKRKALEMNNESGQ